MNLLLTFFHSLNSFIYSLNAFTHSPLLNSLLPLLTRSLLQLTHLLIQLTHSPHLLIKSTQSFIPSIHFLLIQPNSTELTQSLTHNKKCFTQNEPTEWLKINLTLFKSHISHKWENIINLFEDIYKV